MQEEGLVEAAAAAAAEDEDRGPRMAVDGPIEVVREFLQAVFQTRRMTRVSVLQIHDGEG